jgi:hypothetical protein
VLALSAVTLVSLQLAGASSAEEVEVFACPDDVATMVTNFEHYDPTIASEEVVTADEAVEAIIDSALVEGSAADYTTATTLVDAETKLVEVNDESGESVAAMVVEAASSDIWRIVSVASCE